MSYNTGYYTPTQFVQGIWLPLANQVLQRSGLPNELLANVSTALDSFGKSLAIDFVSYEFEGRPLVEENAKNVVAAVIEYTVALVMADFNLGCPQFQECIKYVTTRIDAVIQRKNQVMMPNNQAPQTYGAGNNKYVIGPVAGYGQNQAVQAQYRAPEQRPMQGYQNKQQTPLPTSELVASINLAQQRKGEEMDINQHMLHVKPDNYMFKTHADHALANKPVKPVEVEEVKPPVPELITANVATATDEIDAFLKIRLINEQEHIIITPSYQFEVDPTDIYFEAKPITIEDSLINLSVLQLPTLERFVEVKTLLVQLSKEETEPFVLVLKDIRKLNTIEELHASLTRLRNEFKASGLISWVSNNLSQFITLALSERYGLDESGFPFITNFEACISYMEGGNSLNENIREPLSTLIVSRCHQLLDYMELNQLEVNDGIQYILEIDLIKPRVMVPWHLVYRKTDASLGITLSKQRVSINHILAQAFSRLDSATLYIDIMDISGNEYRAFRGSSAQFSPTNYRIQPVYL